MPTHEDHPRLRDQQAATMRSDPKDPRHSALLHIAKQEAAIDEARAATSQAPPSSASS